MEGMIGAALQEDDVISLMPPPPQRIFEYLNGHLIGHYIMKKAISVAVYNHYCDVGIKRKLSRRSLQQHDQQTDRQMELAPIPQDNVMRNNNNNAETSAIFSRDYFENGGTSNNDGSSSNINGGKGKNRKESTDSGIQADEGSPGNTGAFMTPIVARVIIEASSHRVHLQHVNALTFDSTGSSRPLDAIAAHTARCLGVPYHKCDCKALVPRGKKYNNNKGVLDALVEEEEMEPWRPRPKTNAKSLLSTSSPLICSKPATNEPKRRRSMHNGGGTMRQLLQGYVGDNLQKVVSKMFKQSGYNLEKTERGIVFFDAMHNLGTSAIDHEEDAEEVRKEILKEIMEMIRGTQIEVTRPKLAEEEMSTTKTNKIQTHDSEVEGERVLINTANMFFICFGIDEQNVSQNPNEKKMSTTTQQHQHQQDSAISISGKSVRSSFGSCDSYDDYSDDEGEEEDDDDDDESLVGLRQNKLAQMLLASKNSPIPHCQSLWGMQDVELKICPEALEIIANQATNQNAGVGGVRTILEKLLFTVKFEILGKNVSSVEITEDFVMGKCPPIYHYSSSSTTTKVKSEQEDEEEEEEEDLIEVVEDTPKTTRITRETPKARLTKEKRSNSFTTRMTDFDEAVLEGIEL